MAEGLGKSILDENFNVLSAGSIEFPLDVNAIRVMHELDLDISNQSSKKLTPDMVASADVVVDLTIQQTYGYLDAQPHLLYIPLPFTDPNKFRESAEDVRLPAYRKVRDELRELIGDLANYCLTPET